MLDIPSDDLCEDPENEEEHREENERSIVTRQTAGTLRNRVRASRRHTIKHNVRPSLGANGWKEGGQCGMGTRGWTCSLIRGGPVE